MFGMPKAELISRLADPYKRSPQPIYGTLAHLSIHRSNERSIAIGLAANEGPENKNTIWLYGHRSHSDRHTRNLC